MKKSTVIASVVTLMALSAPVFAGPCRHNYYYGGGWYSPGWRRDGLGTAAAITSIVANGVSIVSNIVNTSRYYSQPVYIQTPVYQTPIYRRPVYTPPPVVHPAASPAVRYVAPVYQTPVYTPPPVVVPVMPPAATYRRW